jgi:hypothetical protein
LTRVLAKLAVEAGIVVCSHSALKRPGVSRSVKEPRCDPQSSNLVTGNPSVTDLVNLALQISRPTRAKQLTAL